MGLIAQVLFSPFDYAPISIKIEGVGSVTIVDQEAVLPFVVKYFPELPVWLGSASTVAHDAAVPLVVRYLPELPV